MGLPGLRRTSPGRQPPRRAVLSSRLGHVVVGVRPAALGWLTVGHLAWGGFGVYVLLRSAGQGRWPATIAGGVYLASPYLLAHTFEGHYPHVWAACWYPWAFWAFMELRAGRVEGVVDLAVSPGHDLPDGPSPGVVSPRLGPVGLDPGRRDRKSTLEGARTATRQLVTWAGVMGLSLGLTAVELAPQWAIRPWLLGGHESGRGAELPVRYHLQIVNAFQLLSPTALGGPSDYFGSHNYWETVFSIGFVPLVLAVFAIARHANRRVVHGWLVLVVFAVWFACGRQLGLFTLFQSFMPGMSGFRVPARSLFLANLAAAVLVGLGAETIQTELTDPKDWRKLLLRLIGVMTIMLLGWSMIERGPESVEQSRTTRAITRVLHDGCFWFAASGMASLVLLGCSSPQRRNQRLAGSLLGLLALVELGWSGSSLLRFAPVESFLEHGSDRRRTRWARIAR